MKDAGNITRDEAGNSFFTVNDNTYKLPRLNWQYEEKFLIAMNKVGVDLMSGDGKPKSVDIDLLTEGGTELRETIIEWLFYEASKDSFIHLTPSYQLNHFSSIIEVYEVLAKEIEAISYFLSQAQPSNRANSDHKLEKPSGGTSSIKPHNKTSKP